MKRRPGHYVAALALLGVLGSAGSARAQLSININPGYHHPGGSVRFGSVPPPPPPVVVGRPVAPAVLPGSVRYEHWHDQEHHFNDRWGRPVVGVGPYHHPYRDEYLRRFRPGWRPVTIGSTQYYFYPTLPPGAQPYPYNGVNYYVHDNIYYQPYLYEGQTGYIAVPPPIP